MITPLSNLLHHAKDDERVGSSGGNSNGQKSRRQSLQQRNYSTMSSGGGEETEGEDVKAGKGCDEVSAPHKHPPKRGGVDRSMLLTVVMAGLVVIVAVVVALNFEEISIFVQKLVYVEKVVKD